MFMLFYCDCNKRLAVIGGYEKYGKRSQTKIFLKSPTGISQLLGSSEVTWKFIAHLECRIWEGPIADGDELSRTNQDDWRAQTMEDWNVGGSSKMNHPRVLISNMK